MCGQLPILPYFCGVGPEVTSTMSSQRVRVDLLLLNEGCCVKRRAFSYEIRALGRVQPDEFPNND